MTIRQKLYRDPFALCCLLMISSVILAGVFAPWLSPYDPDATKIHLKFGVIDATHWLGTDHLGRDIFSRLLWGIRTSVFYALFAMSVTLFIGILLGLLAGLMGGKIEESIMQTCDIMLSFPGEVMILALVGFFGPGGSNMIIAMIIVKWAWYARMTRSIVQQYTHKNYVLYAQIIGASHWHILIRHLLPVAGAELLILSTADVGSVILLMSALSFLGLGVQPPTAEWGVMLADAKNAMLTHPEQMLPPGIAIITVSVAFDGLGDFLRDWFDTKQPN